MAGGSLLAGTSISLAVDVRRREPRSSEDETVRQTGTDAEAVLTRVPYVAVVGAHDADGSQAEDAAAVGAELARRGAVVITGGRGGVMEAACRGAKEAGGTTVGILPGSDRAEANAWVDVALPTGLGEARNALVARAADAMVAVGGGYGTLSEIALALRAGKRVVGPRNAGTYRAWCDADDAGRGRDRRAGRRFLDSPADAAHPTVGRALSRRARARTRRATRAASTCRATRAARAPTPGCSTRSATRALGARHPRAHATASTSATSRPRSRRRSDLAARGLGGAPHLVPRQRRLAGQPRGAADARPPGPRRWWSSATRTRARSTRSSSPGLRPTLRGAGARPRAPHRPLPDARGARPRAPRRPRTRWARPWSRPPTSARWPTWPALAEVAHARGVPLVVDEAWGAHLAFHEDLPGARARARRRPRRSRAPTRSSAASPSRRCSTSATATWIDEDVVDRVRDADRVDQPELAARRVARRRPPPGGRQRPASCSPRRSRALAAHARGGARDPGPRRARRAPGRGARACSRYDPLRLVDRRARHAARAATSWPGCCASSDDVTWSSRART